MKKIFATDLDGTVIYSKQYDFETDKIQVETHNQYESYMNKRLYDSLKTTNQIVPFVPITTRNLDQYERIQLPIVPKYALVLNGAMLLVDGKIDDKWLSESIQLAKPFMTELYNAMFLADNSNYECTHLDLLGQFFVFIKTVHPLELVDILKSRLDLSKVTVYHKKNKVYVIPTVFEKGYAIDRLKKICPFDFLIAAGDSAMDDSMLKKADKIISCDTLKEKGTYNE